MQDFPFMSDEAQKQKYKRHKLRKKNDKYLWSVTDAAKEIGVSREALYYRIWKELLQVKVIGGHYFIREHHVKKLKEEFRKRKEEE